MLQNLFYASPKVHTSPKMDFTELVCQFYTFIVETAKAESKKNQAEYYERRKALDAKQLKKDQEFNEFLSTQFPENAKIIKDMPIYKERIQAVKKREQEEWEQEAKSKRQRINIKVVNVEEASPSEQHASAPSTPEGAASGLAHEFEKSLQISKGLWYTRQAKQAWVNVSQPCPENEPMTIVEDKPRGEKMQEDSQNVEDSQMPEDSQTPEDSQFPEDSQQLS